MLDIGELMTQLSQRRRIFHSEADLQHALAWQIHEAMPDSEIRLEYNPVPNIGRKYLDIWIPSEGVAIELKYVTRSLLANVSGERFALRNHGAQDITRYDYLKDIQRLESEVAENRARFGFAVLLTNDPLYWMPPRTRGTIDATLRIHEDRRVAGELAWSPSAGGGTTRGREEPIWLNGSYQLRYRDYSNIVGEGHGHFRYLAVQVDSFL